MTKYGFGRMRSVEQRVCSAGVRRCSEGLFARFSGAAIEEGSEWVGIGRKEKARLSLTGSAAR